MTQTVLSDSRFAMWRAVIALVHVDGVVSPYEIHFVREHLRGLTLTPAQTQILAVKS